MSRIGKKPIPIPQGVIINVVADKAMVKGPKGEEQLIVHPHVQVNLEKDVLTIAVANTKFKVDRALWGLHRALLVNMIKGVTDGFEKKLEMVGVGYKAAVQGTNLTLEAGFSHPVTLSIPEGLKCTVDKNVITIAGINKQSVGDFAARVRAVRKPEPYKGKGIKYMGEVIRRKAGKAAKAAGTQ